MAVHYVKDFSFAPSPPRPTVAGYARGGHVKPSTPKTYAKGGSCSPDIGSKFAKGGSIRTADAPVKMGSKPSRNPDDAVSPGSPKRTPMGAKDSNASAARNKFAAEGRGTPVATKQDGDVERMSGYSDFKKGGSVKHDRLKNLGHYAHGGKVKASSGEVAGGKAGSGTVKAPVKPAKAGKAESHAGTPKTSPGSRVEMKSGTAHASMGGLSRGTSPKKNAAIHAKMAHKGNKGPSLGALASALSGAGVPHQAAGAPPGMAPGMGAPPGGQMGAIAPQAPTMGGGPPMMSHGGSLKTFTHVAYK